MAHRNGFDSGDGLMLVSAGAGIYAYFGERLMQIHTPQFAWLSEFQPVLTASASIVAVVAGIVSIVSHIKKMKKP